MDDGWSVIVSVPLPQYLVLFINTYYLGQTITELDYPIYIAVSLTLFSEHKTYYHK